MDDVNDRGEAPQFAGEIESLLKFNCGVGVKEIGCISVVEQLLRLQLNELINKCIKLCRMRNGNTIQLQDLLFVFAKNESKFARLVKHMIFKDKQHKSKFSSAMGDGSQLSDYYSAGNEGSSPGADTVRNGGNVGPPQPRIAAIKQFLDTFLVAERVKEACFSPQLDKVKKLRLQREERFASLMSANEYVQWNQSKIPLYVQFRMKVKIFIEQLVKKLSPSEVGGPVLKIHTHAMEAIHHLSTEWIAQVADEIFAARERRLNPISDDTQLHVPFSEETKSINEKYMMPIELHEVQSILNNHLASKQIKIIVTLPGDSQ